MPTPTDTRMRLPIGPRCRADSLPADALLLRPAGVSDLLAVLARVGGSPTVFRVEGGFLLTDTPAPMAGSSHAVRLRRVAPRLFVPPDGDVSPALHADEADALTREAGLVLLPGLTLAFDHARPVQPAELLAAPVVRRDGWQPLPEPPQLADRIRHLEFHHPNDTVDAVLDAAGDGVGIDEPRPANTDPVRTIAGRARLTLGGLLARIGGWLGWRSLQAAGASMIDAAVRSVPRLSEGLLGRQEAALRELLRQFREGLTEEALRRALPIGGTGPGVRGGTDHPNAQLPWHDLLYSLGNLLSTARRGPASIWHGGEDVQRDLAAEYRKAAHEAAARGDHRRAAYIFGRLLADFHAAAAVLSAGGLHHDAAVLIRDRLNDPVRAAAEFEAAGEFDTALPLYRDHGEHEKAGDLLRRLGDEDAAVEEYQRAARQRVARHGDHLGAGDLLWRKTGRADLAGELFAEGWRQRLVPGAGPANAVPCAVRLLALHARAETPDGLLALVAEGETYLRPPAYKPWAATFFDAVAETADLPHLAPLRDDLRDRAFAALALKLRQHADREARPGTAVRDLLGRPGRWPAARLTDADHALRRRLSQPRRREPELPIMAVVPLTEARVTATARAVGTGDVFVGDSAGRVTVFRPASGRVEVIAEEPWGHISALAVDATGRTVVMARMGEASARLRCFVAEEGGYLPRGEWHAGWGEVMLSPQIVSLVDESCVVAVYDPAGGHRLMCCPELIPLGPDTDYPSETVTDLRLVVDGRTRACLLKLCGPVCEWAHYHGDTRFRNGHLRFGWSPGPTADWLFAGAESIEVAGPHDGVLHWSSVRLGQFLPAETATADPGTPYAACALVRPGQMAAVTLAGDVHWLRRQGRDLRRTGETRLTVRSRPVACHVGTGEVFVVAEDGRLTRVPVPS